MSIEQRPSDTEEKVRQWLTRIPEDGTFGQEEAGLAK